MKALLKKKKKNEGGFTNPIMSATSHQLQEENECVVNTEDMYLIFMCFFLDARLAQDYYTDDNQHGTCKPL